MGGSPREGNRYCRTEGRYRIPRSRNATSASAARQNGFRSSQRNGGTTEQRPIARQNSFQPSRRHGGTASTFSAARQNGFRSSQRNGGTAFNLLSGTAEQQNSVRFPAERRNSFRPSRRHGRTASVSRRHDIPLCANSRRGDPGSQSTPSTKPRPASERGRPKTFFNKKRLSLLIFRKNGVLMVQIQEHLQRCSALQQD